MIVAGNTDDEILSLHIKHSMDIATETYDGVYDTSPYGVPSAYIASGGGEVNSKAGLSVFSPVSVRIHKQRKRN